MTAKGNDRPAAFGDSLQIIYSNPSARAPAMGYRSNLPSTTSSAVLKWPQRLLRLPAGSDFSVFSNSSGNFSSVSDDYEPRAFHQNENLGE